MRAFERQAAHSSRSLRWSERQRDDTEDVVGDYRTVQARKVQHTHRNMRG